MKRLADLARVVLILVAFAISTVLLHLPHEEHWSADLVSSIASERISSQSGKSSSKRDDIALVYVSSATLVDLPYVSPIDRERLAKIIGAVDRAEAKIIGLDIILDRATEPGEATPAKVAQSRDRFEGQTTKDELLISTLHNIKDKTVLGAIDADESGIKEQQRYFRREDGFKIGCLYFDEHHAEGLVVSDHVIRLMALEKTGSLPGQRESWPCTLSDKIFAEALAEAAGADSKPKPSIWHWLLASVRDSFLERSSYIAWLLPPTETWAEWRERLPKCWQSAAEEAETWGEWLRQLLFCAKLQPASDTFLTLPAEYVLGLGLTPQQKNERNAKLKEMLHGKIVLIGGNFPDRDQHLTPLSVSRDDFYPGLFIHAQILAQLMDGRAIWKFNGCTEFILMILAGAAGLRLGRWSNPSSVPFRMVVVGRAGWLSLWSHAPNPRAPLGIRKNHRTYFWIEFASAIVILAIAVVAFSTCHVIFPFYRVLFAFVAGAAVGHYAFSTEHDT